MAPFTAKLLSLFRIFLLAIFLCWGVFAYAQNIFSKLKEEPVSHQPVPRLETFPSTATDQKIKDILENLRAQSGWFPDVQLHVVSGIVVIQGKAAKKEHIDWLVKSTERIPEVITVVNKAELNSPTLNDIHPLARDLTLFWAKIERALPLIAFGFLAILAFVLLGRYLNRGILRLWKLRIQNPFLLVTVSRLTLLPIWLFFFYVLLQTLGLSTLGATIIGGTGVLGIIIGLAFKGIAENYLAGLLLATRSPFTKGDLIKIGEYHGYVQNLNMRGTTIIDLDGNLILIPNIMVIQSVVENESANPNTRTSFTVSISYRDSITRVQDMITQAMTQVKGVLKNPAPTVIVESLNAASVQIKVQVWFNVKESNEYRVRSRAMIQTKEILLVNGITIPDEAREVVFTDSLKVQMIESTEDYRQEMSEKKTLLQREAASNLEETRTAPTVHDAAGRDLMHLAEQNPLPVNSARPDLLKKTPSTGDSL